ncbi:uracil-DNA glycosylase family protein [Methanoculleus sp.]|uniref:uracil-DNA glycosylase family protein n=1 Tax=Methanoculleus sp. TaxID=90427 RepID=UPI0025CE29BF|nr:uracil-DNA glycosylase family protein [Methanoculleus sp.]MCK9318389.1 uracil-DNA glycosylase family protein [Methanoculleus sp.]MDD2254430.1 uracil-DNA glycosylase family protein [Methanoculleus sp.]MDD2786770.1 uracil-DNA glycosylase family protein [Methanoculleus sp.]MDD3216893.1 uracil-DNA glycosylase family protein [Methanoculleus sp.]MDD4314959.1 uracil-DNA glycosylase family protein [Methanoculleus sp.]
MDSLSAASVAGVYGRYSAGRPDLYGILLPELLPHDACGAADRRPGRVKVLFIAESPPWAAGRREVAGPADCRRPDYPYFWNDRYDAAPRRAPLSGRFAENLFALLDLEGQSRRENLDLFTGQGCYLVDTVRCVYRKNRKASIPADLVRLSARGILGPEIAALAPECVVALGNTALTGLREIEPYAGALAGAGITAISREARFEESRLLCLPYPGWRNRRFLDLIEAGFAAVRDRVS